MKRVKVTLQETAEYKNLSLALYKAAKEKRHRNEVQYFFKNVEGNLKQLQDDILNQQSPYGRYRCFTIHDPKKRLIHAACFEDRILHHALMNKTAHIFERAMVDNTYACRPQKGVHKAVKQVQKHLRAYPYYVKIDIDAYFSNIDHEILMKILMSKFKGDEIRQLFYRILKSHQIDHQQSRGLPIGSLTSQFFANYYLDGLDRLLNNDAQVRKSLRYMDDIIWWCDSRAIAKSTLNKVKSYLFSQRNLNIKPSIQIQKSTQGVTYCGFCLTQGTIRLSKRKKRRYQQRRLYWERAYQKGEINALQLQQAYAAVHSITTATDSLKWRQMNLKLHPSIEV